MVRSRPSSDHRSFQYGETGVEGEGCEGWRRGNPGREILSEAAELRPPRSGPYPATELKSATQRVRAGASIEARQSKYGKMRIKQAESVVELLSYIEKIERLNITSENYKD